MKDKDTTSIFSKAAVVLLAALVIAFIAVVFAVLLYIDLLVAVLFALLVLSVAAFLLTRTLRKRAKVERQIKKLCKKKKYRFVRKRKFIHSFRWNTKEHDFTLQTGKYMYFVHYLTVKSYNASLTFESKEGITYASKPIDNKLTVILNLKPEIKKFETSFLPLPEIYGKKCVRVILVNPVCREMYERDRDGGLTATGNGMENFGYTVMTGTGFVEAVQRNEAK